MDSYNERLALRRILNLIFIGMFIARVPGKFFVVRFSEGHAPPTKMQENKSRRKPFFMGNSKFQG